MNVQIPSGSFCLTHLITAIFTGAVVLARYTAKLFVPDIFALAFSVTKLMSFQNGHT